MFAAFSHSGLSDERRGQRAQIFVRDAVRLRQQRRIADRPRAERIELRGKVSVAADRLREIHGADDLLQREVSRGPGAGTSSAGGVHCSNSARVSASTEAGSCRYFSYNSSTYPRFSPVKSCQAILKPIVPHGMEALLAQRAATCYVLRATCYVLRAYVLTCLRAYVLYVLTCYGVDCTGWLITTGRSSAWHTGSRATIKAPARTHVGTYARRHVST